MSKKDDRAEALAIVITFLALGWVFRAAIIALVYKEISDAVNSFINFLPNFIIGLIEVGIPLLVGYYIAEKLIDDSHWEDSKVTLAAIMIILLAPYLLSGVWEYLIGLIGFGMAANVIFRFISNLNL